MKKERINEIWGIFFLLLGLFTLASLLFFDRSDIAFYTSHPSTPVQNYTGIIGAYVAFGLLFVVGYSAYLIPAVFLLWSSCFFMQKVPEKKFFKFVGLLIALCATSTLIATAVNVNSRMDTSGVVGHLLGSHILRYFGQLGSFFLAGCCLMLSLLLATDFLIYPIVRAFASHAHEFTQGFVEKFHELREELIELFPKLAFLRRDDEDEEYEDEDEEEQPSRARKKTRKKKATSELPKTPIKVKRYQPGVPEETSEKQKTKTAAKRQEKVKAKPEVKKPVEAPAAASVKKEEEEQKFEGVVGSSADSGSDYELPSVDMLKRPAAAVAANDNLQENSEIIETTLAEFGIEVKVVEVEQGPVITRYELLPAPGVKVNSIAALSDDLALALKTTSVRLIIPIPGKSAVGVEVPNSVSSSVSFREMVETQNFKSDKHVLPLVLGKDTSGKPLIADLTTMPHMLIAGTTGSGKTVCVNSIVMGLLYSCSPEKLKFIMVDPKMVELACYNKIPHMLSPVVTDIKKAAHTLNWVVNEMENRYKLLAAVGVRNISAFNSRVLSEQALEELEGKEDSESVVPAQLPYIVVIIDELADLMMVAQDKVEGAITRLAQLSRAVGIHLILATQRPSVDVITGVIKANFPARISFKVASKVDSRTVLDTNGADRLIGRGDMLFMQPGDDQPTRGQGAFVTDQEINKVMGFVVKQGEPEYHPEIQTAQEGKTNQSGSTEKDELYDQAVDVVLQTRQASTSNLQRRLRLGYTRAARIIDQMEAHGVIGPSQGAKPRDILIQPEDLEDDEDLVEEEVEETEEIA